MSELVSTRDPERAGFSYSDAIIDGLAPDGGLFTPLEYPAISEQELDALRGASYEQIFSAVKSKFSDFPADQIEEIGSESYSPTNFPRVEDGNIVPLMPIVEDISILQLSLGPTAAFKDMAMQPLGREMDFILTTRGEKLDLLGATSGDTGSAAEAVIKNMGRTSLFMLSPVNGMSEFQKAQMGTLSGENIFNLAVDGTFDDCQDLVKAIEKDPEFANLGAVNSINWGRITSQVPYYVAGYLQATENTGDPVDFIIPTGNFGNILAGYIARKMGVPIRKLIAATNENDVMHDVIQLGLYKERKIKNTTSPSMDISKASNFERIVFNLFEGDAVRTRSYMEQFERDGSVRFEDYGLDSHVLTEELGFESGSSDHDLRVRTIKEVYDATGLVVDPHTADALGVSKHKAEPGVATVCLSTALPVKFEGTIEEALGFVPKREGRFEDLSYQEEDFYRIDNDIDLLKNFIRQNRIA